MSDLRSASGDSDRATASPRTAPIPRSFRSGKGRDITNPLHSLMNARGFVYTLANLYHNFIISQYLYITLHEKGCFCTGVVPGGEGGGERERVWEGGKRDNRSPTFVRGSFGGEERRWSHPLKLPEGGRNQGRASPRLRSGRGGVTGSPGGTEGPGFWPEREPEEGRVGRVFYRGGIGGGRQG